MTKTETTKAHIDGGTYRVLAIADTRNGWAIAVTEWTTYRGEIRYEVKRVSPDNMTMRLAHFGTEREARDVANKTWRRDR